LNFIKTKSEKSIFSKKKSNWTNHTYERKLFVSVTFQQKEELYFEKKMKSTNFFFCKSLYRQIKIMEGWRKTRSASYIIYIKSISVWACEHLKKNFFQTFVRFFYVEKNKREFTTHPLCSKQKKLNFETNLIFLKLIK
jgi:hypothetical protein